MPLLIPEYLSIDFNTLVTRIKEELQNSATFADYDYEGSNIAVLIELCAYIGELNTYFLNKLAKNTYLETADIYENVNRLARQIGYEPKGVLSARGTATITISGGIEGDEIQIPAWSQMECPDDTYEDETIKYSNTTQYSGTLTSSASTTFNINVRQGEVTTLSGYTGSDLIDNELLLPTGYGYDNDLDDTLPSIEVSVDDVPWERISDFYDSLSALYTEDNVYMFVYDKYNRSKVMFNSGRNVPTSSQNITIKLLESLGINGTVGADAITGIPNNFIYNVTRSEYLTSSTITMSNSAATIGAASSETVSEVRDNALGGMNAQYRNVTGSDYKSSLNARSDVAAALAWGEQEESPSGSILEYNKVHISLIPTTWSTATVVTSGATWTTDWDSTGIIMVPTSYATAWETEISRYIEPKKMLSTYEQYDVPELIYFSFKFGIRKLRIYTLANIQTDITNKLIYYFRSSNRNFNEEINFMNILEYLLDTTEISPSDEYSNIKGIRNLNIRDIDVSTTVHDLNTDELYPYYTVTSYTGENQLRSIKLGYNQFPMLSSGSVSFTEET